MAYGHFTARSAYAELVCEDTENGGLLVFVKQTRGSGDGEARITLTPNDVAALRTWLVTDRDAEQCACPELHPGVDHAAWTDELARSEPGDIPLHLETHAEWEARTTGPRIVAYRSDGGKILRCLAHYPDSIFREGELWPVTSEDLPDGGICTAGNCGRDVLAQIRHANGS